MSSEARFKFRDNDRGMMELQPNTSIIDDYQFIKMYKNITENLKNFFFWECLNQE